MYSASKRDLESVEAVLSLPPRHTACSGTSRKVDKAQTQFSLPTERGPRSRLSQARARCLLGFSTSITLKMP